MGLHNYNRKCYMFQLNNIPMDGLVLHHHKHILHPEQKFGILFKCKEMRNLQTFRYLVPYLGNKAKCLIFNGKTVLHSYLVSLLKRMPFGIESKASAFYIQFFLLSSSLSFIEKLRHSAIMLLTSTCSKNQA